MKRLRAIASRFTDRVGRRDAVLLIIGFIWFMYGAAGIATGAVTTPVLLASFDISVPALATGWMVTGACAITTGLLPVKEDTFGYSALMLMPILYTSSFFVGFCLGVLGSPLPGFPLGIFWSVIWSAVCALLLVVASWPETAGVVAPPPLPEEVLDGLTEGDADAS